MMGLNATCRYCGCTLTASDSSSADVCSARSCIAKAAGLRDARFEITPAGRAALAEHPRHMEG